MLQEKIRPGKRVVHWAYLNRVYVVTRIVDELVYCTEYRRDDRWIPQNTREQVTFVCWVLLDAAGGF